MPAFGVHPSVTAMQKGEVTTTSPFFCAGKQDPLFYSTTPPNTAKGARKNPCSFCGYAMFESLELNFESGRQQLFFDRKRRLFLHCADKEIKFQI